MAERHLPNLVVAGVTKAGSTSLFSYLAQHPEVCASTLKELHYFSPLRYGRPPTMALEEYAAHFAHCGGARFRLEATPVYFYGGPALIEAVRATLPDPRVLVILRDPADRFWSSYRYKQQMGGIDLDLDFATFIARCEAFARDDGRNAEGEGQYRTLLTGCYAEHAREWFDAFGPRFRVVFFEHLRADPAGVVEGICRWLGIDAAVAATFDYAPRNETFEARSAAVNAVKNRVARAGRQALRSQPRLRAALNRTYVAVGRRPLTARMREEDRGRLQELYRGPNAALGAELRRQGYADLPGWLRTPAEEAGA